MLGQTRVALVGFNLLDEIVHYLYNLVHLQVAALELLPQLLALDRCEHAKSAGHVDHSSIWLENGKEHFASVQRVENLGVTINDYRQTSKVHAPSLFQLHHQLHALSLSQPHATIPFQPQLQLHVAVKSFVQLRNLSVFLSTRSF